MGTPTSVVSQLAANAGNSINPSGIADSATSSLVGYGNSHTMSFLLFGAAQTITQVMSGTQNSSWVASAGLANSASALNAAAQSIKQDVGDGLPVDTSVMLALAASASAFANNATLEAANNPSLSGNTSAREAAAAAAVVLNAAIVGVATVALSQDSGATTRSATSSIFANMLTTLGQAKALSLSAFAGVQSYMSYTLATQQEGDSSRGWSSPGLNALAAGTGSAAEGSLIPGSLIEEYGNVTYLGDQSAGDLAFAAQYDPSVLSALERLSPYAYFGQMPQGNAYEMSAQQLGDRAAFMLARTAGSTSSELGVEYRDLGMGVSLGANWIFGKPIVAFAGYNGSVTMGGAYDDRLYGGAGNDTLDGGSGGDWLEGGRGNDTYVVDNVYDHIEERAFAGTDTVIVKEGASATGQYVLGNNIENGVLFEDISVSELRGNSLNNHLKGNSGDNTLEGGLGSDVLEGLGGDDTYVLRDTGDTIIESADGGVDTVRAYLDYYVLADNVENLQVYGQTSSASVEAYGNDLANDILAEGTSNVYLYGRDGDDTLHIGSTGWGYLSGGYGNDTLRGGAGDDFLDGYDNGQRDTIYGGGGSDTVYADGDYVEGASGNDLLVGSMNQSVFAWGEGDGLDTVYTGYDDIVQFKPGGNYSITAYFSGGSLVLSTGAGEGVIVGDWNNWEGNKATVVLPDGTVVTPASLEAQFHPAVTGWEYSGGTYAGTANNFNAVVQSFDGAFGAVSSDWMALTGWSVYNDTWTSGLQSAVPSGRKQAGHDVYSWSMSYAGHVSGMTDPADPASYLWANLQYDFWKNDSGEYEFAVTQASAGYGGQTQTYFNQSTQQWDSYTVAKYTSYSAMNTRSSVVLSPAVTSVELYAPGTTAARSSAGLEEASLFFQAGQGSTGELNDAQWDEPLAARGVAALEADFNNPALSGATYIEVGSAWLKLGADVVDAPVDAADGSEAASAPVSAVRVAAVHVPSREFVLLNV